ncbi:MAG TPA: hypothetical protein VK404_08110, partial [Spirosoma sp.]|nr:hypothetical protein [Spirosoma sp.]
MINKLKPVLLAALLLTSAACKDDFLELAPVSQANIDGFYKTPADFRTAVIGAYATLLGGGMYGNWFLFTDQRSDNTEQEEYQGLLQVPGDFDTFTLTTTNSHLAENWNAHYQL